MTTECPLVANLFRKLSGFNGDRRENARPRETPIISTKIKHQHSYDIEQIRESCGTYCSQFCELQVEKSREKYPSTERILSSSPAVVYFL